MPSDRALSLAARGSVAAEAPPAPAAPAARGRAWLGPFASAPYSFLWVGSVVTMSGHFMQMVAQGWLVYELTSSPTWLGIVGFARGLPMLILALPGGVLVDRFDRRRLLIVCQGIIAVLAALLALLVASGLVEPWQVAVIAFLTGSAMVVVFPARQALLTATVERRQLGRAIALASAGQNGGKVLGPSLAGVLIAAVGSAACFVVQAAGFVVALLCTWQVPSQGGGEQARKGSAAQNLLEGLRYIRRDRDVFALMMLALVPCFLAMPYMQLLPIFARDILQAGPEGLGVLMAAIGVGSVLGSVLVAFLPARRQGLVLVGSLVLFELSLVAFALSTSLPLSIAIMGLSGVTSAAYMATCNTLLHLSVPDELRGRVMSAYMTTFGLMPLGALPQGALADLVGAPIVLAAAGLLCCVFTLLLAARTPALRRL